MVLKLRGLFLKIDYIGFVKRTLLIFIVFGAIYSTYYFIFKKNTVEPKTVSAASVQIALKQHALALNALSNFDAKDISAPYKIEGIRSNIDTSLDNYKKEVENFKKLAGYSPAINPESFIDNEVSILDIYDQNYTNLKNLLQYSMLSDLNSLDSSKEIDEIYARSSIATDSIQKITQNQALSRETLDNIKKSLNCLDIIKSKSKKKDSTGLSDLIKNCDKTYAAIKPKVIEDIIAPLKSSDFKILTKNIDILSEEIANKPKVSF